VAIFLHRVGRIAFRHRWYVVLVWAAVLALAGFGAASAPKASDKPFSMPGIESQKAFDLMEQRFPGTTADGASARVVFVAPDGERIDDPGNRRTVERTVTSLAGGPQVVSASDPFRAKTLSGDGRTAYATVTYEAGPKDLTDATRDRLKDAVHDAQGGGLTVEVGGKALSEGSRPGGVAELVGVAVAALVLLVTFGSLAAAGLPLLTALIGVGISLASILALARALDLSATTSILAMMLGLAVGIDYALFVVSRYREERARGHAPQEAVGLAVGTAGSAVVFAGLTVVIALAGLSVVGIPGLTRMGLAASGAVTVAVLVALTLVPALLGFWPNAVLTRRARRGGAAEERNAPAGAAEEHGSPAGVTEERSTPAGWGTRWARFVLRRPLPVLLLGVVALGALALPVTGLRLGNPGDEAKPTSSTERRAYDALADAFGPGFNGPLSIVVDARGSADAKDAVDTVARRIGDTEGIVSVSPARFNQAGDTAVFQAVPSTAPTDERTKDLVTSLRDARPAIRSGTGVTFAVTGTTAVDIDIAGKVRSALVPYLLVVVGLAAVLLLVVFRSLLVPLKAALGYLLSVLASLGSVVLVFQQGHGAELLGAEHTGPIMSLMPIFLVGIVFGLAMDYEVFLVSRMREAYVHGATPGQAVTDGFRHSARVVAAAALIMVAVFAGFVSEDDSMIKMIGFGLASAVLFDAFVVRMAIVPAALALLGRRAWWLPGRLDRMLPRVDVEGEALDRLPAGAGPRPAAGTTTAERETSRT